MVFKVLMVQWVQLEPGPHPKGPLGSVQLLGSLAVEHSVAGTTWASECVPLVDSEHTQSTWGGCHTVRTLVGGATTGKDRRTGRWNGRVHSGPYQMSVAKVNGAVVHAWISA